MPFTDNGSFYHNPQG